MSDTATTVTNYLGTDLADYVAFVVADVIATREQYPSSSRARSWKELHDHYDANESLIAADEAFDIPADGDDPAYWAFTNAAVEQAEAILFGTDDPVNIGDRCVFCDADTSFGSGRFVNRVPGDGYLDGDMETYPRLRVGYLCPDCLGDEEYTCDRCGDDVPDGEGHYPDGDEGERVCAACLEGDTGH